LSDFAVGLYRTEHCATVIPREEASGGAKRVSRNVPFLQEILVPNRCIGGIEIGRAPAIDGWH